MGLKCYPDLHAVPEKIDINDVFRKPAEVMPVVDEATGGRRLRLAAAWGDRAGGGAQGGRRRAEGRRRPLHQDRRLRLLD